MIKIGSKKILINYMWLISCLILLSIIVIAGKFATGYLGDKARQEIFKYNESAISLHSSHLTDEYKNIEKAVKLMSGSPWIAPALISRKEKDIANANKVLDRYRSNINDSVCYLMDSNGLIIASSNRNEPDSFVGKSYQFRPYFMQAIKGAPGRYFALGGISFKRGFYASYPVRESKGQIIGVVVIKQNIDAKEDNLAQHPYFFFIDPNGIIFIAGNKAMNFKSLWPVSRETQLALLESKQFGEKEFDSILPREITDRTEITFGGRNYLVSRKVINPEGWSMVLMTTKERIYIYKSVCVIVTILISAFIIVPLLINYKISRSAEMVRESEMRFHGLFNETINGVAIFHAKDNVDNFIIKDINPAGERISRVKKQDAAGKFVTDVFPGVKELGLFNVMKEVWKTGEHKYHPVSLYRDSRISLWIESNVYKLASGEIVVIYQDITERKRAEEEKAFLEIQNRQLQKAESLGRMAGAIAHHFNNQLQIVMGNLELAMAVLSGVKRPAGYLADSMQSARKAAEMSGLMLTYLGQTQGKREPLDLSDALRQSLTILREAMPKDVALNIDMPSPGPTISADANQVQQVITNLVTNAWEAMDDGRGTITMTVKTICMPDMAAAHIYPIDWKPQENAYACLEVADTGCGIVGKEIEKIFDPFFSSKFTGRGLGLAVVLGIIKFHGGAIFVESEPGRGSIFRVLFPVSRQLPLLSRKQEKADEIPMLEGGYTLLLIEDEEAVRKMAKSMLTLMGHTVFEAKDGIDAVEVFRRHKDKIRCVLCDLTMPRLDGWGTLIALRGLDPGVSVILASGYDKEKVMAGNHPEWPQVFLNKPYSFNELSNAIRRAVA
jgi:C4-dicarboxylate-specific signal transduction histidine kinase/CheY-like chemotaxis protein